MLACLYRSCFEPLEAPTFKRDAERELRSVCFQASSRLSLLSSDARFKTGCDPVQKVDHASLPFFSASVQAARSDYIVIRAIDGPYIALHLVSFFRRFFKGALVGVDIGVRDR